MFPNDLSFDPNDPMIALPGTTGRVGLQVFTTGNVYGLPADALDLAARTDGATVVTASTLAWAGQQQRHAGTARLTITPRGRGADHGVELRAEVTHDEPIKAVKFVLRDLGPAPAAGFWQATSRPGATRRARPGDPLLWRYPWPADDPWPEWETPWAAAGPADSGASLAISVRDEAVRPVRLYAHCPPWAAGDTVVEVVCEGDARHWGPVAISPAVVVRHLPSEAAALADLEEHLAHVARSFAVPRWEARRDVPAWFADTRLVVTLHGMHWTGYAFNTFDAMADIVRFVTDRVDGTGVLAYLPGWEGRYYAAYPNYRPAEALGGAAAFDRLVTVAHDRGVRVMPMFGMHGANVEAYPRWADAAFRTRSDRMPTLVNKPDWDGDRAGEDDQVFCNPGEPAFRAHLLGELDRVVRDHGVDGVFLDTSACWFNDPRFNLVDGYRTLVGALRAAHPDLLVAGEGWFDALLALFPVNQTWHDPAAAFRCPDVMARFARALPHLSVAAPGRGSTGVHESGWGPPPVVGASLAPGTLPAIAFVDDTLRDHADTVAALLEQIN